MALEDVAVVAWLHDVDGVLAEETLRVMYPASYETVWRVLGAISYSKERRICLDALRENYLPLFF